MPSVSLLKSGNRLVVNPTDETLRAILEPLLSFRSVRFLFGYDRVLAGGRNREIIDYACFGYDHRNRLATSWGFHHRITQALAARGYHVVLQDLTPHPNPSVFEPDWDRLFRAGIELRGEQPEFLIQLLTNPCGRFDCPPGFGKSFLIGCVATLLPRAKIHVVTKRVPVLCDRIYPELCQMVPNVGIVGGGKKINNKRIQLYSADSLHHSTGQADILIGDECHELAADKAAGMLARYDASRNYGLSATQDMRIDKKDLRNEAIFGPILMSISYQQAQEAGMVVPIQVVWSDVISDEDPLNGIEDPIEKKRWGYWRNEQRNEIIAGNSRLYDEHTQELITVETVEHALFLKRVLPGHTLVYSANGCKPADVRYFQKLGVWPHGEPTMTAERKANLTAAFETGRLKKVICTTVWNVGVNFTALAVLNRADGGGSPIGDTQIPGRTSRPDKATGKQYARVHDYKDQFSPGPRQRAANRKRNYTAHGWEQIDASDLFGGLL